MNNVSQAHELFTQMLFVDAIVGAGVGPLIAGTAEKAGLASLTWHSAEDEPYLIWNRTALEALSLETLQELYTGLKLHEVTHAHQ